LVLFSNREVDGKIEEIDRVTSMSELDHKLRELVRMIYKQAAWITCHNYEEILLFSNEVHVPYPSTDEIFHVERFNAEISKETP